MPGWGLHAGPPLQWDRDVSGPVPTPRGMGTRWPTWPLAQAHGPCRWVCNTCRGAWPVAHVDWGCATHCTGMQGSVAHCTHMQAYVAYCTRAGVRSPQFSPQAPGTRETKTFSHIGQAHGAHKNSKWSPLRPSASQCQCLCSPGPAVSWRLLLLLLLMQMETGGGGTGVPVQDLAGLWDPSWCLGDPD